MGCQVSNHAEGDAAGERTPPTIDALLAELPVIAWPD
jgi:hypothetical protein